MVRGNETSIVPCRRTFAHTRCWISLLFLLVALAVTRAADSATELFQKGLIAEEVNRDLDTAIRSYQAAIAQMDEQRKLAATAIYRLAECHRKQGKPDLAKPLYARVVREFPDQTDLARLSAEAGGGVRGEISAELAAKYGFIRTSKNTNQATLPTAAVEPDEEAKEIQRLTAILRDSPDLVNQREGHFSPLQRAAIDGKARVVRFLIEQGLEVDRLDHGLTPLHFAASWGRKAVAELLLEAKANANASSPNGVPPLHFAAKNGYAALVAVLLARGADPNAQADYGEMIMPGGQNSSVANWSNTGIDGGTPIHWAARQGHTSIIRMLLEKGANAKLLDPRRQTTLQCALSSGVEAAIRLLIEQGVDVNSADGLGQTALMSAVRDARAAVVDQLLSAGADVNKSTVDGRSAVTALHYAVGKGNLGIIQALLVKGADVNFNKETALPPLHAAIGHNNLGAVEVLLRWKADVEIRNKEDFTPLQSAVSNGKRREIVEALLKAGANPNVADSQSGQTPIFGAVGQPKLVELLLAHGAQANFPDRQGTTPLESINASLSSATSGQRPPFDRATQVALAESDRLLRAAGANPDWRYANAITISRKAGNERLIQFQRGTNNVNRYTLYEVLARFYVQGSEVSSPLLLHGRSLPRSTGPRVLPSVGVRGILPSFYGAQLPFPDFRRVTIRNVAATNAAVTEVALNLLDGQGNLDCTKDRVLEWGDLVEIPETDHAISDTWHGLNESFRSSLKQCLRRRVTLSVKGSVSQLIMSPGDGQVGEPPTGDASHHAFNTPTFALGSVVPKLVGLLRSTSDLTRVKVRRPAVGDQPAREWTLNVTLPADSSNDLWLRDGDLIEVPDKE